MEIVYQLTENQIKELATRFFYDWYNSPGNNTQQGFDSWWEVNKWKYQNATTMALSDLQGIDLNIHINDEHVEQINK
jgi:hypothetical protein